MRTVRPTLPGVLAGAGLGDLAEFARAVISQFSEPRLRVRITLTAITSTTKQVRLEVIDRLDRRVNGRFVLVLHLMNGAAIDASTAIAMTTGVLMGSIGGGVRHIDTDSDGSAVGVLTYSGTAGQQREIVAAVVSAQAQSVQW